MHQWWQWLLAAGLQACNGFAVVEVVHLVDPVNEQNTRLSPIPCAAHYHVPQGHWVHLTVNLTHVLQWEWFLFAPDTP